MACRRCLAATVPAGAAAPSRTRGACASGAPPGRQARAAQPAHGRQRARGADGLAKVFLLEQVEQDHAGHDHVAAVGQIAGPYGRRGRHGRHGRLRAAACRGPGKGGGGRKRERDGGRKSSCFSLRARAAPSLGVEEVYPSLSVPVWL
eukprot:scaffold24533_cov105-Isochrysis_galbana.AAC.1